MKLSSSCALKFAALPPCYPLVSFDRVAFVTLTRVYGPLVMNLLRNRVVATALVPVLFTPCRLVSIEPSLPWQCWVSGSL